MELWCRRKKDGFLGIIYEHLDDVVYLVPEIPESLLHVQKMYSKFPGVHPQVETFCDGAHAKTCDVQINDNHMKQ